MIDEHIDNNNVQTLYDRIELLRKFLKISEDTGSIVLSPPFLFRANKSLATLWLSNYFLLFRNCK